jgi:hypothetical protein
VKHDDGFDAISSAPSQVFLEVTGTEGLSCLAQASTTVPKHHLCLSLAPRSLLKLSFDNQRMKFMTEAVESRARTI